jgi:hypothetical protein
MIFGRQCNCTRSAVLGWLHVPSLLEVPRPRLCLAYTNPFKGAWFCRIYEYADRNENKTKEIRRNTKYPARTGKARMISRMSDE